MTFNDFVEKLQVIERQALSEQTRFYAKCMLAEIGDIVFSRDDDEAESFLKLFA